MSSWIDQSSGITLSDIFLAPDESEAEEDPAEMTRKSKATERD